MSNTRNIREPSIDALRDIVSQKQAAKFRFTINGAGTKRLVLVDLFTASAMVGAYDAATKPETKTKIEGWVRRDLKSFLFLQRLVMGA